MKEQWEALLAELKRLWDTLLNGPLQGWIIWLIDQVTEALSKRQAA